MKALLTGTLLVVCLLIAGFLGAPTPTGAAPALTPTASPTLTPTPDPTPIIAADGANLVLTSIHARPYGGGRPSLSYPIQVEVTVANRGIFFPIPAGSRLDVNFYVNAPPDPNATPAFTASVTLTQALQPWQGEVLITSAPWQPALSGMITLSAWVNPQRTVFEINYEDDGIGPEPECVIAPDAQSFIDVFPSDYYYTPVEYLACRGAVSGYDNGNGTFSFRPAANTTRGQFAKMVVLAMGWPLTDPATPTFRDVPPDSPFYRYVETAATYGIISGYACGPGCLEYRPGNYITRGQIAKMITLAKGWPLLDPPVGHFSDVPAGSPFYQYIETVAARGVVSGYDCGQGCFEYRPGNSATRGQLSKMLYFAVTQP